MNAARVASPVVCCDLDGVIWLGDSPIAGSADAVARLRAAGRRVVFVTNNSSATRDVTAGKLASMGVAAERSEVVSSATAAAEWCATRYDLDEPIMVLAGAGVIEALTDVGFTHLVDPSHVAPTSNVAAVVCGWHRNFDFARLAAAADALHRGADFVATNLDPTYPDAGRRLPGNGAIVAAVATAAGRSPDIVCGKPNAPMAAVVRRIAGNRGIMIGDRPSTDGEFAAALGWPFALVLSGIAGPDGEESVPEPPPTFLAADLAHLVDALAG